VLISVLFSYLNNDRRRFFSSAPSRLGVIIIFHPEEQSHIAHADSGVSAYNNPFTGSV